MLISTKSLRNEHGQEFWYARDLQKALEYTEWRNFLNVINKAKSNCKSSNFAVFNHFVDVNKTIDMPKGASKEIPDIQLSRYAAYLAVLVEPLMIPVRMMRLSSKVK